MKKIFIFFVISICFFSCKNNDKNSSYQISGSVKHLQDGEAYIQIFAKENNAPDTLKITNGKFNYTNNSPHPELAVLVIATPNRNIDRKNIITFFTEPNSKITIEIDTTKKEKFIIKGSKANDEFTNFKIQYLAAIDEKERVTFENINPINISNPKTMDSLMKLSETIQEERKNAVLKYINLNKNSFVGAGYAYFMSLQGEDSKFINSVYNSLGDLVKSSFYGTALNKILIATNKTDLGATAADFSLPDMHGKTFKLSEFYAGKKLVLLDFWASWCGPCRRENPTVVAAYNKYNKNGFEIIGISLDDDKEDWLNAIKKDNLTWTHVSDLKGWQSSVAALYNITSIPINYLIDGNGKILSSNLRGADLEKKLAELLSK